MVSFSRSTRLRHWVIKSRWQRWLFPGLCMLPYLASILWLLLRGQGWIAQVLLTPLVMAGFMAILTLWLARQEFRSHWGRR